MKGKGEWIIPFILGILLQMFITYASKPDIKQYNEDLYIYQIDSIIDINLDLQDSIEIIMNNIPKNIIKDTIVINNYYEKKIKDIHIISNDSLLGLALEGTDFL